MGLPTNYYNFFEICKLEEIPTGSAKGAIGLGLGGITKIAKLKPIAHLFREFSNGEFRMQYGILQKHYDSWKQKGKVPKVSSGRPPKWKDDPTYENLNIPIKGDLYNKLKKVVDNANATSVVKLAYRDAIYLAINEFCDRRPQFLDGDK